MTTPATIPPRLCAFATGLVGLALVAAAATSLPASAQGRVTADSTIRQESHHVEKPLNVHYLEVVTPSMNETCDVLAKAHGVVFGDPIAELGNARTADLKDGGRIGVRAPMHDAERPVVRPYVLVADVKAALEAAEKAGAKVAVPPMEIPGQGTIAIYVLGGIEHGLWQH